MGNAWPTNPSQCHIADSYPFFKIKPYSEMRDISTQRREEMKNELIFLTELSRFLNKKAPLLLQVRKIIIEKTRETCLGKWQKLKSNHFSTLRWDTGDEKNPDWHIL